MVYVKLEDVLAIVEKNAEGMSWSENPHESGAGFELLKRAQSLRSLPTDDGVTDEMVERASKAVIETANWRNMRGIDEGSPLWGKKVARAALKAALGPLPTDDGWEDKALDKLDAWRFNVMLECQGGNGKCAIGGAELDLSDLLAILDFVSDQRPLPAPPSD